jgi:hypothetical protein
MTMTGTSFSGGGQRALESLSSLYGLALDAAAAQVLGNGVELQVEVRDETTAVLPLQRIIRRFQRNGLRGLVVVGVQTIRSAP